MNKLKIIFVIVSCMGTCHLMAGDLEYNLYDAVNRGDYEYTSDSSSLSTLMAIKF